jgi:hypothetical protein
MKFTKGLRRITAGVTTASAASAALLLAAISIGAAPPETQPATPAADPAPAIKPPPLSLEARQRVELLVKRLGHPDWRTRDKAQDELAAMGEAVEADVIDRLRVSLDSQTNLGLQGVLAQLAAQRRLGPTLVSVDFKDATPQDTFAELSKQSHIPIQPLCENLWRQREWPTVTLKMKDRPFWEVMRAACMAVGTRAVFAGGEDEPGRLLLTRDSFGEMPSPVSFSGSFMVLATKAARRRPVTDDQKQSDIELELTFFADPKWRIISHPDMTAVDTLLDGQSAPLPKPEPLRMQVYRSESPIWMMRTLLPRVPLDCKGVGRLRASFGVSLLELSDPVEFKDVLNARNVVRRSGSQSVQLQEVTRVGSTYRVKITISRSGLSAQEWRNTRELEAIQLVDEKGTALSRGTFETAEVGDQVTYEITYFAGPEPVAGQQGLGTMRLHCRIPLEAREVAVPFELRNIAIEK